jgi:hypothetical protein
MTPHPGDLLSAYADGELAADERTTIDDHVEGCPSCRRELAATTQAKAWVTGLPVVEPPFGFFERMLLDPSGGRVRRRTWATRVGAIGLAATASIWLAVLGLSGLDGRRPSGVPALNSLVSFHEHPLSPRTDQSTALQRARSLGLPPSVDDYALVDVVQRGPAEQAIYRSGDQTLSIFLYQRYSIDESQLPAESVERDVAGRRAWILPTSDGPMLVSQIGPNAVFIIGGDAQSTMAGDVDPRTPARSMGDRVRGAGEGLLHAFGLG